MLNGHAFERVYLAVGPAALRKSISGLAIKKIYQKVRKSRLLPTALKFSYLVLYKVRKTIKPFNERSLFNVHFYELTLVGNKKKLSLKG